MNGADPVRRFRHVDFLALWIALGALGLVLGLGVKSTMALVDNTAWVEHSHRVIESLDDLTIGLAGAVNARRGFSLTGDQEYLDGYTRARRDLTAARQSVRTQTLENPDQQRRLDALEPLLARVTAGLDAAVADRRNHGFQPDREAAVTGQGTRGYNAVRAVVTVLVDAERRLLVEREQLMRQSVRRTKINQSVGVCVGLSLAVTVVIRVRQGIQRRQRSMQAIQDSELEIKRLNEDLERRVAARTAQLEMANGELESFSYAVVHDLRAPLRGMAGFAEVLLNECTDTLTVDAQDCLGEIRQNAHRMAILIDALVSMSRITRSELNPTRVDLTSLARTVAGELATGELIRSPDLGVHENLWAEADPSLARALLEILLGNSWKFTGKAPAARIEFGATDMAGEQVLFVRDNGAGFDMAHAGQLFIPFGRLHTVAEFPGLGIGLATAQRIVQRHGGRIWADGHVGEGAVFYFTFGRRPEREVA